MIDTFLLLTPILLLGVVALLGFVGCISKPPQPIGIITISPSSGPSSGNTPVTITGSEELFNNTAKVKFGAAPNDIDVSGTAQSETVVTAVTPAHAAGPVEVEVDYTADGLDSQTILANGSYFTYYDPISPLQPPALSRENTGSTNSALLPAFSGTVLVVATVQWGAGSGATLTSLNSPGVSFVQIGTTDMLNPQQVATFYAFADLSSGITVTASLNGSSSTDFNLLVSAYDNVDTSSSPVSPVSTQGTGTTPSPSITLPTSALAPGDLVYAVAIARGAGGLLKGSWSPDPDFTGQIGQNGYLLLETYLLAQKDIDAGQISVRATDADGTATSRWYIFAMAIKHA